MIILESVIENTTDPGRLETVSALRIKLPFKCEVEPGILIPEINNTWGVGYSPRFIIDFGPKKGALPLSWFEWYVSE